MKIEELKNVTKGDYLKDQFGNVYQVEDIDLVDSNLPARVRLLSVTDKFMSRETLGYLE